MEEWKSVIGYEGYYEVSNLGNVRSVERTVSNHTGVITLKPRLMKQSQNHKGYSIVYLSKDAKMKTISVHRLVALAFIPNPQNKPQVNHIDGNKTNNRVDNLEWVTNQENHDHAVLIGLYPNQKELRNRCKKEKKTQPGRQPRRVVQIDKVTGNIVAKYDSIAEAGRMIGCKNSSNIGGCCRKAYGRKTICGYIWKYQEEVM
jgi:hypothetical protein